MSWKFEQGAFNLKYHGRLKTRRSVDIDDSAIGVGFECLDRFMFDPEPCYARLAELGAKWARCQTGWSLCEKEKGIYDFSWLDDIVDKLIAAGLKPWFCVSFGNKLYMPDAPHESAVGRVPIYYGDAVVCAWQNYCRALAKHFKGRVSRWEVWNEANHGGGFWAPGKPNGADYAKLVRLTAEPIKEIIPDAMIIAGAAGAGEIIGFLGEALEAGLADHIHRWSIHPYRFRPEQNYASEINVINALLKQYNPAIQIWQGECGCPSVPKGHNEDWPGLEKINEDSQAIWVARRVISDLTIGLELSSYFHTADLTRAAYIQSDGTDKKPVMMGLLNGDDYSPKKSYFALQNLCAIFDKDTCREDIYIRLRHSDWPKGGNDSDDVFTYATCSSFVRKGYPLFVYYLPADTQAVMDPVKVKVMLWNMAEKAIKNPVLINVLDGSIYEIPDFNTMDGWWKYMFPGNLPLTNYPLIITDANAV
ncbi:MAG: beta-galactosidase [Victivallales bacterium]|nr:beta-galactosidase [Victivallales bacterium]